jgi:phosphatidate cytidylyltransferase
MEARDIGMRAASAAVLAPLAVIAFWVGGWAFVLLMGVACAVLAFEWGAMSERRSPILMSVALAFGIIGAAVAAYLGNVSAAMVLLVFGAIAAALFARMVSAQALDAAYGVLYIGWPVVLLVWLRTSEEGGRWTLLLFAVTWAADIFAYLVGSLMKGPKLWPRLSPKKTWSGFLGGLLGGTAAAMLVVGFLGGDARLHFSGLNLLGAGVIGFLGAAATMAGDLWESALKRRYGVKDSGAIIPGHGGLLDRVDGMMFCVVVIAAVKLWVAVGWMS